MALAIGCLGSRLEVLSRLIPQEEATSLSSGAALFPATSTTMPSSTSYTKDSQMAEVGGAHTGDEAELARMGYKQELKYAQFT